MQDDDSNPQDDSPRVAIIGAGSIGCGFAIVHALAGSAVVLYDEAAESRQSALRRLAEILCDLQEFALIDSLPDQVLQRITVTDSLARAVATASFIHECTPEQLDIKRQVVSEIDDLAGEHAIIASASSAIPASEFAAGLAGRSRCLVAHPGNPPFLLRVVELVPAPFTRADIVQDAAAVLRAAGMAPIAVHKEVRGFVFNRLQGALLREAYCLVRDGVADVEGIDRLVRDGLGLRWSVIGPFETVDLNTRGGIRRHASLLGPAYEAMGAERGQHDPWTPELVDRVAAARRQRLPLEHWADRVRWRDRQLMSLLAMRRNGVD